MRVNKEIDVYDLINSKAISEYCRKIKHQFNTEELAILVCRNNRMSIKEKINMYNYLLKEYPDMEVWSTSEHHESIKRIIQREIQKLKLSNKKLIQEEENCIWVWARYNQESGQYDNYDLEHAFNTYKEVYENIHKNIKNDNNIIAFYIRKINLCNKIESFYGEFNVKDKRIKLIDSAGECYCRYGEIALIGRFINIPNPFKKGDILVQKNKPMENSFNIRRIWVLDNLCTWKNNLKELLENGIGSSLDMTGHGYFFSMDYSIEVLEGEIFDYDLFEYYEGELTGKDRILKNISSFLKERIDLDMFLKDYNKYTEQYIQELLCNYNDEELEITGLDKKDIKNG